MLRIEASKLLNRDPYMKIAREARFFGQYLELYFFVSRFRKNQKSPFRPRRARPRAPAIGPRGRPPPTYIVGTIPRSGRGVVVEISAKQIFAAAEKWPFQASSSSKQQQQQGLSVVTKKQKNRNFGPKFRFFERPKKSRKILKFCPNF